MEEQELAERCRQGEMPARKELYERYAGRMLALCLRYVPDRETARDLLHDGFLQIFSVFPSFRWRGEGSLRAWMERVVVNVVLQSLRRNDVLRHSAPLDELPQASYERPDEADVERIPTDVLTGMVGELPDGQRTVFNLYVMEGKSHKEIAEMLGINEKSSSSQLARAKTLLAAKVRGWLNANE